MAAPATVDEPYVGRVLTPSTFTVEDEVLASHYEGLDLPPVPGVAVPSTVVSRPDNDYIREAGYRYTVGHLWLRQGWRFHRPLVPGATYRVEGRIEALYPRGERNVVQYETRLLDPEGTLAAQSEHHQSFLREAPASGTVSLREPGRKPAARRFEVPEGEPLAGLERTITLEMCARYFQGKTSYHTDAAASRELGFEDVVVGGRMTMAYAAHVLEARFGEAWLTGGEMEVKFTNPVWVDDTVRVHGVATGPLPDDPARTGAFVWIDKPDGTVVLVANASVQSA